MATFTPQETAWIKKQQASGATQDEIASRLNAARSYANKNGMIPQSTLFSTAAKAAAPAMGQLPQPQQEEIQGVVEAQKPLVEGKARQSAAATGNPLSMGMAQVGAPSNQSPTQLPDLQSFTPDQQKNIINDLSSLVSSGRFNTIQDALAAIPADQKEQTLKNLANPNTFESTAREFNKLIPELPQFFGDKKQNVGSTLSPEEAAMIRPEKKGTIGKIGDIFPKLYMKVADTAGKGSPGTAQFGTPLEFLEATEGKSAEEMRKEMIGNGLSPEQADKALLYAVNETSKLLGKRFWSKSLLRDVGGRMSVELPLILGTGGFGTRALASKIPGASSIVEAASLPIRGGGWLSGAGTVGSRLALGGTEGAWVTEVMSLLDQGKPAEAKDVLIGALTGAGGELLLGGVAHGKPAESTLAAKRGTAESDLLTKVSPKLTQTEQKIAISEGRATRSKPGLFGGKPADIVAPSKDTELAMNSVKKNIKGPEKMTDFEISNAANSKIKELSVNLEPKAKAVFISKETATNLDNRFKEFKEIIESSDEFAANPAAGKNAINRFNRLLDNLRGVKGKNGKIEFKTLDDAWKTRIEWDKSFPKSVKDGTSNSPISQIQYDIWVKGRNILNETITDTKTGLGKEARQAFDDMSGLYSATEAIETHGISTKAIPGPLAKRLGGYLGKYGAVLGAGAIGYEAYKLLK